MYPAESESLLDARAARCRGWLNLSWFDSSSGIGCCSYGGKEQEEFFGVVLIRQVGPRIEITDEGHRLAGMIRQQFPELDEPSVNPIPTALPLSPMPWVSRSAITSSLSRHGVI